MSRVSKSVKPTIPPHQVQNGRWNYGASRTMMPLTEKEIDKVKEKLTANLTNQLGFNPTSRKEREAFSRQKKEKHADSRKRTAQKKKAVLCTPTPLPMDKYLFAFCKSNPGKFLNSDRLCEAFEVWIKNKTKGKVCPGIADIRERYFYFRTQPSIKEKVSIALFNNGNVSRIERLGLKLKQEDILRHPLYKSTKEKLAGELIKIAKELGPKISEEKRAQLAKQKDAIISIYCYSTNIPFEEGRKQLASVASQILAKQTPPIR